VKRTLTEFELEALLGLCEGETQFETADRLGRPAAIVGSAIWRVRHLLGAKTDAQAVALAYHKGILVPPAR
jgi:DNA-binding CsgD family transcriptional regulator